MKPILMLRAEFPGMQSFVPEPVEVDQADLGAQFGEAAAIRAFRRCATAASSGFLQPGQLRSAASAAATRPPRWLMWRDLDAVFLAAGDGSLQTVVEKAMGECGDDRATGGSGGGKLEKSASSTASPGQDHTDTESQTLEISRDVITTDPVNSGVLFVRPTARSATLLCDWIGRAYLRRYDGHGLRDQPLLEGALHAASAF